MLAHHDPPTSAIKQFARKARGRCAGELMNMAFHFGLHFAPLRRSHLEEALARERDAATRELTNLANHGDRLLKGGFALLDEARLIAVGGIVECWPEKSPAQRGEAWALVTDSANRRQLVRAVRFARAHFDACALDRIDFYIRADASYASSFARALGANEGPHLLKCWGPDGADYCLFARVRDEENS